MILITGNKNKVKEFEEILGFKINSQDLDIEEIQTLDIEKVVEDKARKAYDIIKKPVLTEDTGLFLNELNGLPGALVKFFLNNLSKEQFCDIVKKDRTAIAKTSICYFNGKDLKIFTGEIKGKLALKKAGEKGFGFDDIFIPNGYDKTFAQINNKNNISMRKLALEKLKCSIYKK